MSTALTAVLALLAILVANVFLYRRLDDPLKRYPGPFLATLSNLWQFLTFFSGRSHAAITALHEKFGSTIRIGPASLSFSDLAAYNSIYGHGNGFEKGPYYDFARDPSTGKGSIFAARTHDLHKPLRRMVSPALSIIKVRSYEPTISRNIQLLLDTISTQQLAGDKTLSAAINISTLLHRFMIKTIFEIVYGNQLSDTLDAQEHISRAIRDVDKFVFGSGYLPWLSRLMNSRLGRSITHRPKFAKDGSPIGMTAIITKSQEILAANSTKSSTSLEPSVLRSFREVSAEGDKRMADEQISLECFNLIMAGQGSTTASLIAILYELGTPKGQEWQHRIRKEALRAPEAPASTLHAVIKETLRFRPPFASGFPRDVAVHGSSDPQIPGLAASLPPGTTVSCNFYVLGRSKEIWGKDANEWKPERWLEARISGEGGRSSRDLEDRFVVFGKGPRSCLGKEISMRVLTKTVTEILGRWSIESHGELVGKNCFEMQYESCWIAFLERGSKH